MLSPETPEVFLILKILHHCGCATFLFQEFLVHATIPAGMVGAVTRLHDGQILTSELLANG